MNEGLAMKVMVVAVACVIDVCHTASGSLSVPQSSSLDNGHAVPLPGHAVTSVRVATGRRDNDFEVDN